MYGASCGEHSFQIVIFPLFKIPHSRYIEKGFFSFRKFGPPKFFKLKKSFFRLFVITCHLIDLQYYRNIIFLFLICFWAWGIKWRNFETVR